MWGNRQMLRSAAWLAIALLATACGRGGAEWVFRGGRVYTADAQRRVAEAVAVDGGRIVYVGDAAGAAPFTGPATRVVDLAGRMLLPSFTDAHVHMLEGGASLDACNVAGIAEKDAILAAIAACAATHPEAKWIAGSGWSLAAFPDANPSKQDLDRIVPDRPVFLIAEDGHSGWASSRALAAAKIDRTTPDPPRGRIEHDANGEPSGALRETAMEPVQALAFDVGPITALRGLHRAVAQAHAFGITSFVEARSTISAYDWVYRALDLAGMLDARVVLSLWFDPARGDEQFEELASRRSHDFTKHVHATAVKLFADGVAESRTAYLLEPYEGGSDRGSPNFAPERLAAIATRLDHDGFQLHFHAIGDAAVRDTLDAIAAARAANGPRDARDQIAHLQLVDPADWPRFASLGVFADVQALWACPEDYVMKLDVPALGAARAQRMYPIGSLVRAQAPLAAGSDWPVTSMNPLAAIQVALTRRDPRVQDGAQLGVNETVDLATMLDAYTIGGARLMHAEAESGSIEVGKSADLVVLDRDLFATPPGEIAQAQASMTLFEGELVYGREP
jgi:predicted amidohydrolase YtcJ